MYVKRRRISTSIAIGLVVGCMLGSGMWMLGGIYTPETAFIYGSPGSLAKFASYKELKNFLTAAQSYSGGGVEPQSIAERLLGGSQKLLVGPTYDAAETLRAGGSQDYSGTNIQVAGVDEADMVKTDGEYIYLVSGNAVFIVKAYPPQDGRVLSKLSFNGTVGELFVGGDKLVVFLGAPEIYSLWAEKSAAVSPGVAVREISPGLIPWTYGESTTIQVYDLSDRASPTLDRNITIDGSYFNSRMIGDYVYVVVQKSAVVDDGSVDLPTIQTERGATEVEANTIYYSNHTDYAYVFAIIMGLNVQDATKPIVQQSFLLGATCSMYVSLDHMYITSPYREGDEMRMVYGTTIHKIRIQEDEISYVADGHVPGWVLNQFSMDEDQGYFRIATTGETTAEGSSGTNVYVLNATMGIVGKLEGLAPGETMHSARFMGSRAYLVTFKQIDPLFVVDLADPRNPAVLGKLKIPGYSDYLHPYDETHLIGVGKETEEAKEGDFAWYEGVKVSLFDVSDVANPKEIAKYEIGDRGTDSPVLTDHKAFLFSLERNLLVIPVLVAEINQTAYPGEVPPQAYGEYVYQGAYVFNISPDGGIVLTGRVTHLEGKDDLLKSGFYFESKYTVERALYIGDVLYTISAGMIRMNGLPGLEPLNSVELS